MMIKLSLIAISLLTLSGCGGAMLTLGTDKGMLSPCPSSPNCVSSQATDASKFVEPIMIPADQGDTKAVILNALDSFSRVNVVQARDDYIHAEFTSLIFRFVDDVEFYFPATEAKNRRIDIRSASRVGYSDLGANRKRVEAIREKIAQMTTK